VLLVADIGMLVFSCEIRCSFIVTAHRTRDRCLLTICCTLHSAPCWSTVLQSVSNGLHYQGAMSTDYNEYAELKNTASR
jgi:hypothetical protein